MQRLRLDGVAKPACPFPLGENSLYIAYYASAEMGCHLALDWDLPYSLLDLFCEFRCQTNGLALPAGNGLLGALSIHGLEHIPLWRKKEMRELALRGGPYSSEEQLALLDYCQTDVDALVASAAKDGSRDFNRPCPDSWSLHAGCGQNGVGWNSG